MVLRRLSVSFCLSVFSFFSFSLCLLWIAISLEVCPFISLLTYKKKRENYAFLKTWATEQISSKIKIHILHVYIIIIIVPINNKNIRRIYYLFI